MNKSIGARFDCISWINLYMIYFIMAREYWHKKHDSSEAMRDTIYARILRIGPNCRPCCVVLALKEFSFL